MADRIRSYNLMYCEGARFIKETVCFYKYPEGKEDIRVYSHCKPKGEFTFDESGKLRDYVSYHDDVNFACKLFYDQKGRLGFAFILNVDKTKVVGGAKYEYDNNNRILYHKYIAHYGGHAAAPIEGDVHCFNESFRYRGRKITTKFSTPWNTRIRRNEIYIPALYDGIYDFKQHLAPASLIHNRMTVPYLLADRPWFQVKKSNISGKYFCTTRLVFNERGHWINWQVLDNNEQPSIVFQREITYFDDYSSVSFQSLQNEKD